VTNEFKRELEEIKRKSFGYKAQLEILKAEELDRIRELLEEILKILITRKEASEK